MKCTHPSKFTQCLYTILFDQIFIELHDILNINTGRFADLFNSNVGGQAQVHRFGETGSGFKYCISKTNNCKLLIITNKAVVVLI